jgi:hypothetical protein
MLTSLDAFVSEGNVEIYLAKSYLTYDARSRDHLMRLLLDEESRMGAYREHLENAERRVREGLERVAKQRERVCVLPVKERPTSREVLLLATYERLPALLEDHLRRLYRLQENSRL